MGALESEAFLWPTDCPCPIQERSAKLQSLTFDGMPCPRRIFATPMLMPAGSKPIMRAFVRYGDQAAVAQCVSQHLSFYDPLVTCRPSAMLAVYDALQTPYCSVTQEQQDLKRYLGGIREAESE